MAGTAGLGLVEKVGSLLRATSYVRTWRVWIEEGVAFRQLVRGLAELQLRKDAGDLSA